MTISEEPVMHHAEMRPPNEKDADHEDGREDQVVFLVKRERNGLLYMQAVRGPAPDGGRLSAATDQLAFTGGSGPRTEPPLFVAAERGNGLYDLNLTEDGLEPLETALGLGKDLGLEGISEDSSLADLMDRRRTGQELSRIMREGEQDRIRRLRRHVLEVRYWGSAEPSLEQKSLSRGIKLIAVGAVGLWSIHRFGMAIQDIEDIPGILTSFPSDVLHPITTLGAVKDHIGQSVTYTIQGIEGVVLTVIVEKVLKPFRKIYRKDQLVTGQRPAVRAASWLMRYLDNNRSCSTAPTKADLARESSGGESAVY